jgi:hypothetical protein
MEAGIYLPAPETITTHTHTHTHREDTIDDRNLDPPRIVTAQETIMELIAEGTVERRDSGCVWLVGGVLVCLWLVWVCMLFVD